MKIYPKRYENLLTSERSLKKCDINKVGSDIGLDFIEYRDLLKETLRDYERVLFKKIFFIYWLLRRYTYDGKVRSKNKGNGFYLDSSFGIFMRNHVGISSKMIYDNRLFVGILSYHEDFFPGFDAIDFRKEKMEYPFEYVNFEHLFLVFRMPERMELINIAEKERMTYAVFFDYVINYIKCYNEEHDIEKYEIEDYFLRNVPCIIVN